MNQSEKGALRTSVFVSTIFRLILKFTLFWDEETSSPTPSPGQSLVRCNPPSLGLSRETYANLALFKFIATPRSQYA